MPYPFAHPAAVLPLIKPLGRLAVPSALVIGSVLPDLWYFMPNLSRADTHSAAALLWFCLPIGLVGYLGYHLLIKEPLIALLPRAISARIGSVAPSLPRAPWRAVIFSLVAGAATHLGWDALTHPDLAHGHNFLQHASTLAGTAYLAWYCWRAPQKPLGSRLSLTSRACVIAALATAAAIAAAATLPEAPSDLPALRQLLRTAGIAALEGFGAAIFV